MLLPQAVLADLDNARAALEAAVRERVEFKSGVEA